MGEPSSSAWAVTPLSVTTVLASLKTPLWAAHSMIRSAASTGVPSDHVTPSLIVYVTVSGSSESMVQVPNWSLLMRLRSAS